MDLLFQAFVIGGIIFSIGEIWYLSGYLKRIEKGELKQLKDRVHLLEKTLEEHGQIKKP